jgi:hypothetical protein
MCVFPSSSLPSLGLKPFLFSLLILSYALLCVVQKVARINAVVFSLRGSFLYICCVFPSSSLSSLAPNLFSILASLFLCCLPFFACSCCVPSPRSEIPNGFFLLKKPGKTTNDFRSSHVFCALQRISCHSSKRLQALRKKLTFFFSMQETAFGAGLAR